MKVIKMKNQTLDVYLHSNEQCGNWLDFEKLIFTIDKISNKLTFKVNFHKISSFKEITKTRGVLITSSRLSIIPDRQKQLLTIVCHDGFYSTLENPKMSSWPYWFDYNSYIVNIRCSNITNTSFLYEILSTYSQPPVVFLGDIGRKASEAITQLKQLLPTIDYHSNQQPAEFKIESNKNDFHSIHINEIEGSHFGQSEPFKNTFLSVTELNESLAVMFRPEIFLVNDSSNDIINLAWHLNETISSIGYFKFYSTIEIMRETINNNYENNSVNRI